MVAGRFRACRENRRKDVARKILNIIRSSKNQSSALCATLILSLIFYIILLKLLRKYCARQRRLLQVQSPLPIVEIRYLRYRPDRYQLTRFQQSVPGRYERYDKVQRPGMTSYDTIREKFAYKKFNILW